MALAAQRHGGAEQPRPAAVAPRISAPRKTILLRAEQGLGDTIQFARYAPLIAAMGATVVLEVQPELKSLLARLAGAATVIARDEAPPPFDVHCPLGSLPLVLKTELATVPAQIPYLAADEALVAKWSARLGELPRPRFALAWSGNPNHDNDRNRSIPFAKLAPLLNALNPPPLAGEGREGREGKAQPSSASSATFAAKTPRRSPPQAASPISAMNLPISLIPLPCWRYAIS